MNKCFHGYQVTIDSNLSFKSYQQYLQENKSKVKCPCKNCSLHEYTEAMNNHEAFCNFSVQYRYYIILGTLYNIFEISYCPLIWMFHSRRLNNKINSRHEKALVNTYQDNTSTFQELINKDNSVSIHNRNLQDLVTEMFNTHRGLSPEILRETFIS